MKLKIYLSVIYCSLSIIGYSQTTINRNNYFTFGNAYSYNFLDSIEIDTVHISGNNATWDFSNAVQYGTTDTLLFALSPSVTPFYNAPGTNYNLSNLCLYRPVGSGSMGSYNDSLYTYFISDSGSIHFIGDWAYNFIWEAVNYHLTDTEQYFKFPFSFNDNFVDSFAGSSYDLSGSGWWYYNGNRFVEADGFGTLILPNATYQNCLRIKSRRYNYVTSMWSGLIYTETYTWFQLKTNGPVLEIETDSNYIHNAVYYYNNPSWVGINELFSKNDFSIYPNPVNSILNGALVDVKISNFNLRIYNQLGQCLKTKMIDGNRFELGVDDLPNGLYFGKIFIASTNEQKSFRFMVAH